MIQMTFDSYDEMLEIFEKIRESDDAITFWPTVQHINKFYDDPKKWMKFTCYLYETNPEPNSAAERYSKKNLQMFITDNLELVD